jgi:hypothetical protein
MSKYDAELRRRILSGEKISSVGQWFIECMSHEPTIRYEDFTALEKKLWNDIVKEFSQWWKDRPVH